jgi:hypothetical protein
MKIDSYSVTQSSSHNLVKEESVSENLNVWVGSNEDDPAFVVDIQANTFQFTTEKTYLCDDLESVEQQNQDTRIKLIESLVFALTGKRMKFKDRAAELMKKSHPQITISISGPIGAQGWGLAYDYQEVRAEKESVSFNSGGYVKTADGRTIAFDMNFSMSREYYEQTNLSIRMGNAKVDPLVVVLDGGAPTLSTAKQAFDLDADGQTENISFATGNSGFLALDKNDDGEINNGSELFGPTSGDGFSELRAYDTDKNDWIDESDEVFGQLSVLMMSQDGEKTLFKLGEVGIGAIYLNEISTQYEFKDMTDEYGEMKSSSIFLKENGSVGTIHHIDLAI